MRDVPLSLFFSFFLFSLAFLFTHLDFQAQPDLSRLPSARVRLVRNVNVQDVDNYCRFTKLRYHGIKYYTDLHIRPYLHLGHFSFSFYPFSKGKSRNGRSRLSLVSPLARLSHHRLYPCPVRLLINTTWHNTTRHSTTQIRHGKTAVSPVLVLLFSLSSPPLLAVSTPSASGADGGLWWTRGYAKGRAACLFPSCLFLCPLPFFAL